jgi:hypothetical protein
MTQFHTGSLMHAGIEAQVKGQDPFQAMQEFMERERVSLESSYAEQTRGNMMTSGERIRLEDSYQMAVAMMRHYLKRYGDTPLVHGGVRWKYVTAELSFKIDTGILSPDGRKVFLVGTIDGVGVDEEDPTHLCVIEHKTYGIKPDLRYLKTDHQQTGYVACLQQLIQARVSGCLYDGIMKKVPQPPKMLQNGLDFSSAIDPAVSYWSYKDALVETYGEVPEPAIRAKYAPALQKFKLRDVQDQSPWFTRQWTPYPQSQLNLWWSDTMKVLRDMVSNPEIYPNFVWTGCYDCWVRDLCDAQQLGGDLEYVKETEYQPGGYRPQYKRMLKITPESCGSVEKLLELATTSKENQEVP